ncbi:unnamed protein product [Lactuca saligna]|uniref:Uncharacterized protein n=1 Tax=Lactuca saligna TaxID=75948 RepID=A0AA35Z9P2_LACSI|nr:unnamed protein product [Lactuca saligna]
MKYAHGKHPACDVCLMIYVSTAFKEACIRTIWGLHFHPCGNRMILVSIIYCGLNNEQRGAIADYFFFVYKGNNNSKSKVTLVGSALHPFLVRSYSDVLRGNYFVASSYFQMKDMRKYWK